MKQTITDKRIVQILLENLDWDGHGYWLPDLCIKEAEDGSTFTKEPTKQEFIDALVSRVGYS